jgi:hypothetical protein
MLGAPFMLPLLRARRRRIGERVLARRDRAENLEGDTSDLVRQNAEELEERLVLLKKRKIDKEDFDYFVENQKPDLRVFIDSQPAQAQERAEKLTLHVLEIAARVAIALI